MALDTLSSGTIDHSALNRPTDQYDPNGISRATDSADGGDGETTKASRATAKLAYARFVQDVKIATAVGDSGGPAEFPVSGSGITYADD